MTKKKLKTPKKNPGTEPDIIVGTLRLHPRGFGFVIPDLPIDCAQDVFIPKNYTEFAVDGDTVEVAINPDSNWEKGPDGRILSIIKRGRTHLAGTIRHLSEAGKIYAHVPMLGTAKAVLVKLEENGKPLRIGDRVIMRVLEWGSEETPTICEVSHYVGHISDSSCDIKAAIEEFDLKESFPKTILKEVKKYGTEVSEKDLQGREDFSEWFAFTIDPETAQDYDDALSINKDKKGNYHLGVHIADVAHYVRSGSKLDQEAFTRGNSTYFPGTVVPMLPHELSSQLCSLRQDVIRLTVSVLMDFDKEGTLLETRILRSYIKSKKRFTYSEAKEVLDSSKKNKFKTSLKLMVDLCHLLKKKRSERGSIDFSLPDFVILVDPKGKPTGIQVVEYDITHQLVEEFMLKANEVVADFLEQKGKTPLYRIHEEPSAENIEDFLNVARSLGFKIPKKPKHKDIQKLFEQAQGTAYMHQLSIGFIRSMKLAYYSPENVGHFGLALEHYCHFTSPIRRYSDLIAQRLLFDEEDKTADLKEIAQRCSDQERLSFRAEMSVKLLKKLRLLLDYLHQDPKKSYQAKITRIKPFGLYFEMQELMLEGFLHVSELEDDFFEFNPNKPGFIGKRTGLRHRLGDEIHVRVKNVDLIVQECKWELVTKIPRKSQTSKRKNRR